MGMQRWRSSIFIMVAALLVACSANSGLPGQPGAYDIRTGSITFDGERYRLAWSDSAGQLHIAEGKDFRLAQADHNYLDTAKGSPTIYLRDDERIGVQGQDRNGGFSSFWFPFLLGQALGGPGILHQPAPGTTYNPTPNTPSYRYPPTDTFGRDDTLHGTITNDKPAAPDYNKVKPAPYAVSGQSGGTGGGTAATSKSSTSASGQAGGVGSGTAASSKGGFAAGSSSFSAKGGSSLSSGASSSGGGLLGGAASSKPSTGFSGAKSTGGFSGGGVRVGRR
ncbi:MAG TPA: hypothetical protein VGK54_03755 [Chloroflexota bacterium]|jgi:hypothetical protein